MFCSQCGATADHREKYCSACGAVLAESRFPPYRLQNIPSRRKFYLAAGIAAALLWVVAIWREWVWLALIASSVLILGTIVLLVIAVVKYARRHRGKRTVIVSSACLALFVLAALVLKFGPGLMAHSDNDPRVVILRTAATVGVARAGAFSPDGRTLATGDERGVHSWDAATWRELGFVATSFPVNAVVFSPDSSKLAILGDANTDVLNMQNGQMAGHFQGRADVAAFSADSMYLQVYGQEDSKASLATWELSSGRRSETFAGPASHSMPAFSADGMKIAWDHKNGLIKIRDTRTGTQIISLSVPGYTSSENLRLELSPDGKKVAMLGVDSNVVVLDATMDATVPGRILRTVSCEASALAMAFSLDGSRIALACDSAKGTSRGTARVFEISSGKLLFDFQADFNTGKPVWVRFSPDGSKLATPGNIWDTRSAPELQRGDAPEPMTIDFAADSSKIFGAGRGAGSEWTMTAATVRTWNTSDGREIGRLTIPTTYPGNGVSAFSPDHSKVLLASRGGKGGVAQVYSMADGKLLYELQDNGWPSLADGPFRDDVASAKFSPDGSRIVTGEGGGGNHSHLGYIWDAETGRRLYDLRSGNHYGFGGRFSPDSRTLIADIDSDILAAWDVGSGKLIYRLTGMNDAHGLKLTVDGTRILLFMREEDPSTPAECSVQVRDSATGLLRNTIRFRLQGVSHTSKGYIRYLAHDFSPDGSEVMVAGQDNGTAHILNTATGGLVRHFEGHVGPVTSVAFSPSGSMVLTAGEDHTVRLWNKEDGRLLHILEGHQGSIDRAFFSPDGSLVVAYTDNNRIWLWDTNTGLGRQLQ